MAKLTGLTTKTIRYYEMLGLLPRPQRSESGYRLYSEEDVQRLEFIKKAKHLGLSLEDIRDILALHDKNQPPCIHVLALLDQKVKYIDSLIEALQEFRRELSGLRWESAEQLTKVPKGTDICSIVERGIHTKGELALTWLEAQEKANRPSRKTPNPS
jgi:DNA-binding transcriptional MerR regulator